LFPLNFMTKHRNYTVAMATLKRVAILILVGFTFSTIDVSAQASNETWSVDFMQRPDRAMLRGHVVDSRTGEPVGWTVVFLVETNRNATAHEDGHYVIGNILPGSYTVRTQRVGYESSTFKINLLAGDTLQIDIKLQPSSFRSRAIEVVGDRVNNSELQVERRVDGKELRQQLGRTLAETLQNEPGMTQSSMGPAPARPVLRGLSGDRLQVLEDGRTTGDISSSSPDHALAIDPINSNHIEILRGPAALVYSSNATAGVVNVVRGQIPTELPEHFHGAFSLQGESVNSGLSGGASSYGSIGKTGVRADIGFRTANDIQTPEGKLDNTAIQNLHGALGFARILDWGSYGLSANIYRSGYGIPGDFIGSHPKGVKINLQRSQIDARYESLPEKSAIRRWTLDYTFSHYYHEELENNPSTGSFDLVGSEYSLLTNTLNGRMFHDNIGVFNRGVTGFLAEHKNFIAGGLTFTPQTNEFRTAVYSYQQWRNDAWNIQSGLRVDFASVQPALESITAYGHRRQRDFINVSGGLSASYSISNPLSTSFSVMRTVRMPGIEELFTEGPHLPAYSFEVGNPDLNEEIGHGFEWSIRYASDRLGFQNSWYLNRFSNYLYPRNTGQLSVRRPLPIYQISGDEAQMWGTELLMEVELTRVLSLDATISYVQGTLTQIDEPIPFIPPLTGKIDLLHSKNGLTIGTSVRFADMQNRLGEFEEPTDAFMVFDVFAQYVLSHGKFLHTFSVTTENITDATYRMHLSRVKSIMPEPGRNVKVLYRVYF
jgi:iron complex outermembrane recepter protein